MPGSSLWLIPPPSPLTTTLQTLIQTTIPSLFPSSKPPTFIPHITLTSLIPPSIVSPDSNNAQTWLSSLDLPPLSKIKIQSPKVGDIFFQKLTLACEKTDALRALAQACRAQATDEEAEAWARESYYAHLSLMYSDVAAEDVESKLDAIMAMLQDAQERNPASKTARGGQVVLVPTERAIDEWQPIATRELPDLEWEWEV